MSKIALIEFAGFFLPILRKIQSNFLKQFLGRFGENSGL